VELLGGYLTKTGALDPLLFPELGEKLLADLQDPVIRLRQAGGAVNCYLLFVNS
jgi:hypothetical protein